MSFECITNMKLAMHINIMTPSISIKIGIIILRSLLNIVPMNIMKLFYNAIVLPYFEYAI